MIWEIAGGILIVLLVIYVVLPLLFWLVVAIFMRVVDSFSNPQYVEPAVRPEKPSPAELIFARRSAGERKRLVLNFIWWWALMALMAFMALILMYITHR